MLEVMQSDAPRTLLAKPLHLGVERQRLQAVENECLG